MEQVRSSTAEYSFGLLSKSRISYCVEQAKTLLANEQAHEALEAGWSAYHRSLKNNEEEVILQSLHPT